MQFPHYEKTQEKSAEKAKEIFTTLPPYLHDYSLHLQVDTKGLTALAYARSLKSFFEYIIDDPAYKGKTIGDVPLLPDGSGLKSLSELTSKDMVRYKAWLMDGDDKTGRQKCKAASINQRVSAVANMFRFLNENGDISTDPTRYSKPVKKPHTEIIYLTADQERRLLDGIISMERRPVYSKNSNALKSEAADDEYKASHKKYVVRDCAIITLMLATGLRVSDLVGIDMNHINMQEQTLTVRGKGDKERTVSFNAEARDALNMYLGNLPADAFAFYPDADEKTSLAARYVREYLVSGEMQPDDIIEETAHRLGVEDDDDAKDDIRRIILTYLAEGREGLLIRGKDSGRALFLSSRGTRLSVRAVQNLVKFYAVAYLYDDQTIAPEDMSPHLLRRSFASNFLAATNNIAEVSHALGHSSTNVTSRYYAAVSRSALYRDMSEYKI